MVTIITLNIINLIIITIRKPNVNNAIHVISNRVRTILPGLD